ncbi:MAG: DUF1684 domain-containing protein [Acidobacteriota bacterium]|jgi:uncharacterized protein (DUF1684 family)
MLGLILAVLLAIGADYRSEIEKWRAAEEAALRSETGWLTLAGLEWFQEGENRISLPKGAPDFGIFELRGGKVTLHPPDGAPIEMRPDSSGNPTIFTRDSYSVTVIVRGKRVGLRIRDRNSPGLREFRGMKWYPVQESYRVVARWEAYEQPKMIGIVNVLGDVNQEKSPGRAWFQIQGKEYSLEPVESGRNLFFIFRDATSGKETYGGGRFLYADAAKDGSIILDFNKAVNPPCAFTPFATCPLPPSQNRLPIRIEAGELAPPPH